MLQRQEGLQGRQGRQEVLTDAGACAVRRRVIRRKKSTTQGKEMMITVFMIMVPVLLAFAWGLFLGYSVGKIDGETKAGKDGLK